MFKCGNSVKHLSISMGTCLTTTSDHSNFPNVHGGQRLQLSYSVAQSCKNCQMVRSLPSILRVHNLNIISLSLQLGLGKSTTIKTFSASENKATNEKFWHLCFSLLVEHANHGSIHRHSWYYHETHKARKRHQNLRSSKLDIHYT